MFGCSAASSFWNYCLRGHMFSDGDGRGIRGQERGFAGGPMVKSLPHNAGNTGSVPGPGRSHVSQGN